MLFLAYRYATHNLTESRMQQNPLTLEHKDLLFERLKAIEIPISEFSFANIYLFRQTHNYEIIFGKEVFIRGRSYDGSKYLIPTSDLRNVDMEYLVGIIDNVDYMYPVPEKWLSVFDRDRWEISSVEGDSDYIYSVDKLSTYAGKKLHKKKNLLNFFRKHYRHEALPLTDEHLENALTILDLWQEESELNSEKTDYSACQEGLMKAEELTLCGGIYYAEGEPAGFLLGEELNRETFVIHFAKGLTKFKGIYQYMFNNIAGVLSASYTYMNMEQDLGIEALRHSKISYMPEFKLEKFRVKLKR